MDFIAIDVETANADMASICQIGIAVFSDNKIIEEWVSLINPEDYFDSMNVGIHGINKSDVRNAPKFLDISDILLDFLTNTIVVSHTHFDRVSIGRALEKHNVKIPEISWLDTAKVVRRAWPEFSRKGYGLKNVAKHIGYDFKHHDALEDAKASGHILLAAIELTNTALSSWQDRIKKPINIENGPTSKRIEVDGDPQGALHGEVIVFTGSLITPRREAANSASKVGCKVSASVTKKTTILVVGDQDLFKLNGKSKSSKHLKAEELIFKGQEIRVIKESDFSELIKQA